MQNKKLTIKELCEFFWFIEEKYKLFDLQIKDVYIWEYIRMQVYYKLAISLGVLSPPARTITLMDRIKVFFKGFKNIFRHNFWTLKKCDIVFFSHPRSVNVDGTYIDIYTEYIINELNSHQTVVDFESDYNGNHIRDRKHNVHKLDWIKQLVYLKYFFIKKTKILNREEICLIEKIEQEIFQHYNIKFPLLNFLESKVKLFNLYCYIYLKIFKKISPSSLYIVVSYGLAPVIKAAKSMNIEVKEIQHGIITRYHLGYSFPRLKKELHYFPDKLLVWGAYWRNIIKYPIGIEHVLSDKFRYLNDRKNQFKNFKKRKNCYLIISQAAISKKIAKKILDNKSLFKDKTVIYKLHPGEYNIWKENEYLIELKKILNIEIITSEKNLYYLMAISEYQIGVFSTALYEGVEFNCKTILLNIDGIEYMEGFIKVNSPLILK